MLLRLGALQGCWTLAVISNFLIFLGSDLWTECVQPPANISVHVVRAGHNKQVMTSQVKQQRRDGSVARWNTEQTNSELSSRWSRALKENSAGLLVGHINPGC